MSTKKTRKRLNNVNLIEDNHHYNATYEDAKPKDKKQINSFFIWPTIFILYALAILFLNKVKYHKYPDPKYSSDSLEKDKFFEDGARKHLLELCSYGPKPVGSHANEVKAVKYITDQINAIKNLDITSPSPNKITLDLQKVSGAFLLENFVKTSYYTVYENLQNVVVLLEPENASSSSLLINCHYDTVIDSPGAGDNTASCAVMLELLRALYVSREPLKHNIIFLFNGAEENMLQASHGFITQHPWASSIKTFINLDSAGAGGWEIVFQTGPEHPWLVKAYAESAPYPFGSILGQELFQSGVIPSDTDFRIFRDFGNLPGLDIAYIANGYVYHTRNDRPEYIPPGCIQRAGENLLSVIKHLCSNDNLEDPGDDRHGTMVFFDVVGLFMVHYPSRIGAIFNFGFIFIVFVTLLLKYKIRVEKSLSYQNVSTDKTLLQATLFSLVCMVLVFAVVALVGVLVDFIGQPMFWFTRTYNILLVYGVMSFTVILSFHYLLKETKFKNTPSWYTESLYYDASLVLFSVVTFALTYKDFASAFLPMMWIVGPFTSRYVISSVLKIDNTQGPSVSFVLVTLCGQIIPVIATLHNIESLFVLFIPITGRVGGNAFPDVLIALMTAVTIVLCMQYLVGLIYLCSNLKPLLVTLAVLLSSSLLLTQLTAFGFPYSGNRESPTSQRAMYFHINRNFYNHDNTLNKTDSGIWYLPFDHNGASYIQDNPVIRDGKMMYCEGNYCGAPYLYPVIHVIDSRISLYTSKPPPVIEAPVTVKLLEKEIVKFSPRIVRYTFDVTGPDHMTIFVTPVHGAEMTRWSITEDSEHLPTTMPSGVEDTTYYIYYSYGLKPDKPYRFFIDIKAPLGYPEDEHLVDIAFNGHYISGAAKTSPELESFKQSLPEWIVSLSWICTYDSYLL